MAERLPLLIAHRGWRAAGPENSRRSVVAAFERCDGAEVDVIVTAEGTPILRHDERLADGTPVRTLPLADLRRRLVASDDDVPDASSVLDAIHGVGAPTNVLNLELKVPGAARALAALADASRRFERVTFTSFYASEVLAALALFPRRPAGLLVSHLPIAFVPPGTALLAVLHKIIPAVREAFPTMPLWAWTLNTLEALARARSAGAEAFIGDDVDAMRRELVRAVLGTRTTPG
jgi:glycerophosphoryl diester phosphodiesterase